MKLKTAVLLCSTVLTAVSVSAQYTIAYSSNKGIFVMNAAAKQLTTDRSALLSEHSWSPDGSRLLFYTFRKNKADDILSNKYDLPFHFPLYVMNADGSNQTRLLDFPVLPDSSWSRDGKKILFISSYETGPATAVYVFDLDARAVKRVADRGQWATWSPDSKSVLFASGVDIDIVGADGSNRRRLAHLPVRVASPVWSPDGKQIAFVSGGWWTINADGSQMKQMSNMATTSVRWSPDSKRVLVVAQGGAYVADANGGNSHNLQESRGRVLDAVWSPDGKKIIYRVHVGLSDLIVSINPDGTGAKSLSDTVGERAVFTVSPKVR